jgi:integrase
MRRGHVAGKGRRWYPVVDVRDPDTKQRKRKWHRGHDTKREAERALTEILGRLDAGTYVAPSRRTVAGFLVEDWLPAVRPSLRSSTFSSYRMMVEKHLVPRLGDLPLQQLTAPRLNAAYADMLGAGRRNGEGGLSPRTVRYAHTIMRRALADAVRWNLLARNVADSADPPSAKATTPRAPKAWSAEDLQRFLERVGGDRLYAAYLLAATTGLRRGELLGLRWGAVDLDAGRLSVSSTVVSVDYEIRESTPKTEKSRRLVILDSGTVAALRNHREIQELERASLGPPPEADGLVFTQLDGGPLHPQGFSAAFRRHVEAAGLPRIPLHGLRHTWATLALMAGVHPKIVQERLGHSSIAITLDAYSHAIPTLQETAASLVATLVLAPPVEDR